MGRMFFYNRSLFESLKYISIFELMKIMNNTWWWNTLRRHS